ncbi:uncharacterized protein LOC105643761 isoform X2 [Jatropha curcas]|uniref:uncharacterized protein LOC105643761 isoform X2 n=1 Tax=Jatropha curcas TaxID=180498 RepID=UPI00189502C3|nr:uncharacterized protein LOC105643761 isoform X2 [Jatropha curcas]
MAPSSSPPAVAPQGVAGRNFASALTGQSFSLKAVEDLRSFASIDINKRLSSKTPSKYKGFPAVNFTDDDIQKLSLPYRYALIGAFMFGRPSMQALKKAFDMISFKGDFTLGLIDSNHILINFVLEEDFLRCWLRQTWFFNGFSMRVSKWSASFRPDVDSSIALIWVSLPGLPIHFFDKEALYSIVELIGRPLKVDASTASLIRPSVAKFHL